MTAESITANSESAILERVLHLQDEELSEADAQYLLKLKFPQSDIDRINELSAKAREGALTPDEQGQLDNYLHVDNLLSLMQSKARMALKKHDQGS